jgi:hypothetical protein
MAHPILVTGAAGGAQGSTGRTITSLLLQQGIPLRALVYLPWGEDATVIPLVGAEDVSRVAAALLANPGVPAQNVYPLIAEVPTVKAITEALGRPH